MYFGQDNSNDCGMCDVCKAKGGVDQGNLEEVKLKILDVIKNEAIAPGKLAELFVQEELLLNRALEELLETEQIQYNEQGMLCFNKWN